MDKVSPSLRPADTPAPAQPPALPVPPLDRINDFPDGLSPMLVKELRQGLRTYTFVILFLVLQGLLALVLMTAGAATSGSASGGAGSVVSQIVFCFYALALLVIQPLRGISAISIEVKQNTIDLMVLTRLSAWRIVWGKWCSIVSQSALLLCAIIPYLILRYFFGGMQLFSELFLMLYIFLVSAALTAVTVGLSAVPSVLIRGLVPILGAIVLTGFILGDLTPSLYTYVAYLSPSSLEFIGAIGFLALTLYTGYFFLDMGASIIAPAAENRATRKRLIGLTVFILVYWILQAMDPTAALYAALYVMSLISLDIFTERNEFPRIVCLPFLRYGGPGRLLGRLLYPGSATGVLFFAFLTALLSLFLMLQTKMLGPEPELWASAGTAVAMMIFPAALIQVFARQTTQRFSIYVSASILGLLLAVILSSLVDYLDNLTLLWAFSPVPTVLLPLTDAIDPNHFDRIVLVAWALAGTYFGLTLLGAVPQLRRLRRLEDDQLNRKEVPDDVS